ncbi:hypothetical protein IE4872_CH01607 [Rhizobium gallicum]|uniref:Uncharacterized protein n=1 Tax=Rhizobium gallicum TaxID=56730 RepID=A0A1L5NHC4_9HYPH|nr:hypothetical protein IE4872_CH01607 [Rhizobium gallicum]
MSHIATIDLLDEFRDAFIDDSLGLTVCFGIAEPGLFSRYLSGFLTLYLRNILRKFLVRPLPLSLANFYLDGATYRHFLRRFERLANFILVMFALDDRSDVDNVSGDFHPPSEPRHDLHTVRWPHRKMLP